VAPRFSSPMIPGTRTAGRKTHDRLRVPQQQRPSTERGFRAASRSRRRRLPLRVEQSPRMGTLGAHHETDRHTSGFRGVGELLRAVQCDALHELTTHGRREVRRQIVHRPALPCEAAAYTATPLSFAAFFDGSCATHSRLPCGPHILAAFAPEGTSESESRCAAWGPKRPGSRYRNRPLDTDRAPGWSSPAPHAAHRQPGPTTSGLPNVIEDLSWRSHGRLDGR
jgi:hypothetical protein